MRGSASVSVCDSMGRGLSARRHDREGTRSRWTRSGGANQLVANSVGAVTIAVDGWCRGLAA
jgi:hypothetical protein